MANEIVIVPGRKAEDETKEYYCHGCGQLRLSVGMTPTTCQNCGSENLTVGDPGVLDKQTLAATQ